MAVAARWLDPSESTDSRGRFGRSRWRKLRLRPVFDTSLTALRKRTQCSALDMCRSSPRFHHRQSWNVPEYAQEPRLNELCDVIRNIGGTIIDPLSALDPESDDYRRSSGDYLHLEAKAMQSARSRREHLERMLLLEWSREFGSSGDWIVVDGALRAAIPNAVGLVKSFN